MIKRSKDEQEQKDFELAYETLEEWVNLNSKYFDYSREEEEDIKIIDFSRRKKSLLKRIFRDCLQSIKDGNPNDIALCAMDVELVSKCLDGQTLAYKIASALEIVQKEEDPEFGDYYWELDDALAEYETNKLLKEKGLTLEEYQQIEEQRPERIARREEQKRLGLSDMKMCLRALEKSS
tara:strand:- start:133 stop:669 length:537 start_codon:yes stop_codon:yes gene_type:complete